MVDKLPFVDRRDDPPDRVLVNLQPADYAAALWNSILMRVIAVTMTRWRPLLQKAPWVRSELVVASIYSFCCRACGGCIVSTRTCRMSDSAYGVIEAIGLNG